MSGENADDYIGVVTSVDFGMVTEITALILLLILEMMKFLSLMRLKFCWVLLRL